MHSVPKMDENIKFKARVNQFSKSWLCQKTIQFCARIQFTAMKLNNYCSVTFSLYLQLTTQYLSHSLYIGTVISQLLLSSGRFISFLAGWLVGWEPTNQHTQRKLLNFENWVIGEVSKMGHHFRKQSDSKIDVIKNVNNKNLLLSQCGVRLDATRTKPHT